MIGRFLKSEIGKDNLSNRNFWIIKTLQNLPSGLKILDVGAGEMPYKMFCKHLQYTSHDFNQYDGKGDANGLQASDWNQQNIDIVSDICRIPLPDASFDVILCTEVLEHVPNPVESLKELDRLLLKGGKIIITTPFASLTHFSPYHYSTGFNKYFYSYHFDSLNYRIIEITSNGNYYTYLSQELRRIKSVITSYNPKQIQNRLFDYALSYVLSKLEKVNSVPNKSDELLCYGYFIVAEKL